jgi:YD repeat-containing protein
MAKYEPLSRHLRTATRPVSMTFAEISRLVRGLPPSACRHREWWANNPRMHVQAHAWLELGRRVEEVDLGRQVVRFS